MILHYSEEGIRKNCAFSDKFFEFWHDGRYGPSDFKNHCH